MYIQLDLMYYSVHYVQLDPMAILMLLTATENLLYYKEMTLNSLLSS